LALWIYLTIGAAFLQNLRSVLQKHLKGRLSTLGATFARFVFAAPLAVFLVAVLLWQGAPMPQPDLRFLSFAALGGVSQILATAALVHMFGMRNFAVGTTFSKTETIQAALFGALVLGDPVSSGAMVAIVVALAGVGLISTPDGLRGGLFNRGAALGLASGAAFGVSAVSYRAASLSLPTGDFLIRAVFTLACVTLFQTVGMALWLRWREAGQITKVFVHWRVALWVGVAGGLASVGWFSAMTLQNAAYVRALGQVELLFTFAASVLVFHERARRREVTGIALIALGIATLLLVG